MTDQVLMPGADYQAICNAVRALTGGTAALKSGDIAGALAGVQPGGGGLQVDTGEFVLDADGRFVTLAHQLGKTPGFVVIWTDGSVLDIPTDYHTMVGCVWFRGLTKLPQRLTASSTRQVQATKCISHSHLRATTQNVSRWVRRRPNPTFRAMSQLIVSQRGRAAPAHIGSPV